jgi:hypothetical protein
MVLEISDLAGRTLATQAVQSGTEKLRISTATFANGMYLCRLISGGRVIDTNKLNIQH